jgi:hypothetical protein
MPSGTPTGRSQPQHEFLAEPMSGTSACLRPQHHLRPRPPWQRHPVALSRSSHEHNQDVTHLRFEKPRPAALHHSRCRDLAPVRCIASAPICRCSARSRRLADGRRWPNAHRGKGAGRCAAADRRRFQRLAQPRATTCWPTGSASVEVFAGPNRHPPRSFPAALPMFRLDRIYQRGLRLDAGRVHAGPPWSGISDHAALSAEFRIAVP